MQSVDAHPPARHALRVVMTSRAGHVTSWRHVVTRPLLHIVVGPKATVPTQRRQPSPCDTRMRGRATPENTQFVVSSAIWSREIATAFSPPKSVAPACGGDGTKSIGGGVAAEVESLSAKATGSPLSGRSCAAVGADLPLVEFAASVLAASLGTALA